MCAPEPARTPPFQLSKVMSLFPYSPVSKLPVELLSSIFLFSSETAADEHLPFNISSVITPPILSRVSKHWRSVAHSTPRLWSRIFISPRLLVEHDGASEAMPRVDTTHILTCLSLSGECALEIFIDVRDEDWDFSEPEIEPVDIDSTYDPFSASALIGNSLSILISHLRRWSSLTICTDTWAPMFMALNIINPYITTLGAPLLETLTLARCNHFVGLSPEFQPEHLAKPEFLSQGKYHDVTGRLLPRLKHLELEGVHLDWKALACAVEESQVGGLKSLRLGSHSPQVRPSRSDFLRLLNASAGMEIMRVSGSGPTYLFDSLTTGDSEKARLEKLQRLEVEYRSLEEAKSLFGSISAPTVKELVLENLSHFADPDDDGRGILAFLTENEGDGQRRPMFTDMEDLKLRNVKFDNGTVGQAAIRMVLDAAIRLKSLTFKDMNVESVLLALSPHETGLPCQELEFLTITLRHACEALTEAEARVSGCLDRIMFLVEQRRKTLAYISTPLRQVKVDMECIRGVCSGKKTAEAIFGGTFIVTEVRGLEDEAQ